MVWMVIAGMTAFAVLCVVWPLSKPRGVAALPEVDLDFYRDQLSTLDRDVRDGLVLATEAEGARVEISRRLLAAADRRHVTTRSLGRGPLLALAVAVILAIPAISLGLYLKVGQPDVPDMPLASRQAPGENDVGAAVAQIERHLASHPDDGRGFEILAPLYLRFGRYSDAANAYARALTLLGETATRRTGYAQALMLQADGVVTADARASFEKALTDDPKAPQPQFFLGLAAQQDGDTAAARDRWTKLMAASPPDAPWAALVQKKLASLDAPSPAAAAGSAPAEAPASEQGQAIASMPADQREQAIRGMVDGLAARLKQSGQDRDGWLRLVRAYAVLGEKDKALTALQDARKNLASDQQGEGQLTDLARELGLEG